MKHGWKTGAIIPELKVGTYRDMHVPHCTYDRCTFHGIFFLFQTEMEKINSVELKETFSQLLANESLFSELQVISQSVFVTEVFCLRSFGLFLEVGQGLIRFQLDHFLSRSIKQS